MTLPLHEHQPKSPLTPIHHLHIRIHRTSKRLTIYRRIHMQWLGVWFRVAAKVRYHVWPTHYIPTLGLGMGSRGA